MNKKIIIKAFQGETTKETPFWFLRQAGRYLPEYQKIKKQEKDMLGLFLNPKKATTITLQPVKRFQTSAAIIFSDILMVPYGLGQSLCFDNKKGPRLGNILNKPILKFDKKKFDSLLSPVYKTISTTKKKTEQTNRTDRLFRISLDAAFFYVKRRAVSGDKRHKKTHW